MYFLTGQVITRTGRCFSIWSRCWCRFLACGVVLLGGFEVVGGGGVHHQEEKRRPAVALAGGGKIMTRAAEVT